MAVDEYLASKRQQADSFSPVTPDSSPAGTESKAPADFDQARQALMSSL